MAQTVAGVLDATTNDHNWIK